jgi:hypothetical protein
MSTGLYQDHIIVDRFLASVSATTITQRYVAPVDFDVLGCMLFVSTAPGANNGVILNVNNSSSSQTGGGGTTVAAYNLWSTANAPTILGTATNNLTLIQSNVFYGSQSLVTNVPYALNYPLPGPSGTQGYYTAQSNVLQTETPVTSPPTIYKYGINGYGAVAPDNTYTDYNGVTLTAASLVHAGDVLSFVVTAGGSGASVGSAANLEIVLVGTKR